MGQKVLLLTISLLLTLTYLISNSTTPTPAQTTKVNTEANLKVAFIGDTGIWGGYDSVLKLIKAEGADIVVHSGDFDYEYNPNAFEAKINSILGNNFPYFIQPGNHDVEQGHWNIGCNKTTGCYGKNFQDRMARLGINIPTTDINKQTYTLSYKGLKLVLVGEDDFEGKGDSIYTPYINQQLQSDQHTWKICVWHRTQAAMQVGEKGDSIGWGVYEACRQYGAIIATAHEHSYQRTKTLSSMRNQTVDSANSDPAKLRVEPGKSFAFVSGAGGSDIRPQIRCKPTTYPYGCKGEWAKIYTSSQQAKFGALFIEFNVDGNPSKAKGYFKNIANEVVDQFEVTTLASTTTTQPVCGNGTVETGELCDDSNRANNDQCSADCLHKCLAPSIWDGTKCSTPTTAKPAACAADFNKNGTVDIEDFGNLAQVYKITDLCK